MLNKGSQCTRKIMDKIDFGKFPMEIKGCSAQNNRLRGKNSAQTSLIAKKLNEFRKLSQLVHNEVRSFLINAFPLSVIS